MDNDGPISGYGLRYPHPGGSAAILSTVGAAVGGERAAPKLPATRYSDIHLGGGGGGGRVYAAWDSHLERHVAIKEANPAPGGGTLFEHHLLQEARLAAGLEHPGILPIHDVGLTPDGRIYYTMPIVSGATLAESVAAPDFEAQRPALLRAMLDACEAVAAAHRHGVIHRDIKPANIMTSREGGTRVLDWGLAVLTSSELAQTGDVMGSGRASAGTPQYMSPEQAQGTRLDTRTDVWSLGAVLFEIATGLPLRSSDGRGAGSPPNALDQVAPELAAIIQRAVAGDPSARYANAGDLADDLARYLDGRRVLAYRYSRTALLGRFVRAWRVPLIVAAAGLVALAITVVMAWFRLEAEADRLRVAEGATQNALGVAKLQLARALSNEAMFHAESGIRHEAEILASESIAITPSPLARGIIAMFGASPRPRLVALDPLPRCLAYQFDSAGQRLLCRNEAKLSLWRREPLELLWHIDMAVRDMTFTDSYAVVLRPDRSIAWLSYVDGEVISEIPETPCYDQIHGMGEMAYATGSSCMTSWKGPWNEYGLSNPCRLKGAVHAMAVMPSGSRWLAACGSGEFTEGDIFEYAPPPEYVRPSPLAEHPPLAMTFVDETTIIAGTTDGEVVVLNYPDLTIRSRMATGLSKIHAIDIAADRKTVVARGAVGHPVLLEPEQGLVRGMVPTAQLETVKFYGNELRFVDRGRLSRWEMDKGPAATFDVGGGVVSTAISPDGRTLGITTLSGTIFRSMQDGSLVGHTVSGATILKGGVFSPDGRHWFEAAANQQFVRVYEFADLAVHHDIRTTESNRRIVPFSDNSVLITNYRGGIARLRAGETNGLDIISLTQRLRDIASSPDGKTAALLGDADSMVWYLDGSPPTVRLLARHDPSYAIAVGPGGSPIALGRRHGVTLLEPADGRVIKELPTDGEAVLDLEISADGRRLAAGTLGGMLYVWSLPDGHVEIRIPAHRERISAVTFSPDGQLLVTGSWDGKVRVFGLSTLSDDAGRLRKEIREAWGRDGSD